MEIYDYKPVKWPGTKWDKEYPNSLYPSAAKAPESTIGEALQTSIVKLTFRKVDGTTREMLATTHPKHCEKTSSDRSNLCVVWDFENAEYRRFRWDSIISWSVIKNV